MRPVSQAGQLSSDAVSVPACACVALNERMALKISIVTALAVRNDIVVQLILLPHCWFIVLVKLLLECYHCLIRDLAHSFTRK